MTTNYDIVFRYVTNTGDVLSVDSANVIPRKRVLQLCREHREGDTWETLVPESSSLEIKKLVLTYRRQEMKTLTRGNLTKNYVWEITGFEGELDYTDRDGKEIKKVQKVSDPAIFPDELRHLIGDMIENIFKILAEQI